MPIDPNKKFLYFNKDGTSGEMDDALCFPVSSFIGAETQAASIIDFYFKGSKGTDATVVRGYIDTGFINIKTFYKKLVDQINFGEIAFIKVTDYAERNTHQSDVTFAMSGDVVPTFTLQDTDFIVAGDNLTFDSVQLTGIQTSAESFADNDVSLMTSAAIDDRINTAVAGAASGDITGVDITVGTGLDISQSNTTSGDYSATINLDLTEVGVSGSANQILTDDGDGTITSESSFTYDATAGLSITDGNGGLTWDKEVLTIEHNGTNDPGLKIKSTSGSAHIGGVLQFITDEGNAGASGDILGRIEFVGDNADQDIPQQTYAKIFGKVDVATDGQESGILELQVANHDDDLGTGLTLTGGSQNDEIDVTIGLGSASTTTIAGDLIVSGGDIYSTTDGDLRLRSDDDIALFLDGDNDGTSSVKIVNGASSNVVIISETGSIYTADTIELGHATDTTLARSAAGKVTIEGNEIVTAGAVSVASEAQAPISTMVARRTITQAEANNMHSTPIEIVPAQGANTVIIPLGGMVRIDRATTQSNSATDWNMHYADQEPGTYLTASIHHIRRFMYNETGDRIYHITPGLAATEVAQSLTEDTNKAVEVSFDSAATTNAFTGIDVYLTYYVIQIS